MSDRYDTAGLEGPKYTHHLPAHLISTVKRQREQWDTRCRRGRRLQLKVETGGEDKGEGGGRHGEGEI